MGFFSVIALILFAAKVFGFITLSYWLCLAPVLVDVAIAGCILGLAALHMMSEEGVSLKDLGAALRTKRAKKRIRL